MSRIRTNGAYVIPAAESRPRPVVARADRATTAPSVTGADVALVRAVRARLVRGEPDLPMHICEPRDPTRTLCGLPAGMLAAIDFAEHNTARGPFCLSCEVACLRACMLLAALALERREDGASTPYYVAQQLRRDLKVRPR